MHNLPTIISCTASRQPTSPSKSQRRSTAFTKFRRYSTAEQKLRDGRKKTSISRLARKHWEKKEKMSCVGKTGYGLRRQPLHDVPFKRRKTCASSSERQRLQRLKKEAFHELDKQIRREQMAIVQRIRYLDSLPARDREILLQAEMEVEQEDKDIKSEDDFHEILEDICAIDIAEDDYTEVLQFEYDENMNTTHWNSESFEIAMGGPGDLF